MFADALSLLALPLAASLLLVAIHTALGIQVLARGVIFVDLALAQMAALGATVAFMLGHPVASPATFGYSLAFTFAAALVLASSRAWSTHIPQEALIGVLYVVAAAAAFLLVDKAPQGAEHIRQILTGNILTVGPDEVLALMPLYAAIGALHWVVRRRFVAHHDGRRRWAWDLVFYSSFGVVVTSSVALAGVLLVFAFLIVPAAIGVLWTDRAGLQLGIGWSAGVLASVAGLALSYAADLPTGATMVCTFGAALALAGGLRSVRGPWRGRWVGRMGEVLRGLRLGIGGVLVGSGVWLMVAPRTDQPLLDAVEFAAPGVRYIYMTQTQAAAYDDAAAYADRYAREAERLDQREARSRFEGRPLDDDEVRRISSFLKSYGEMQKGERFVMGEIRARARERARWLAGGLALALGVVVVPGVWGALRRQARRRARARL